MCVLLFLNYSQATGWKNLLRQAGSLAAKCLWGRYFLRLGGDARWKLGRSLFEWSTVSRVSVIRNRAWRFVDKMRWSVSPISPVFAETQLKMWQKKFLPDKVFCFYPDLMPASHFFSLIGYCGVSSPFENSNRQTQASVWSFRSLVLFWQEFILRAQSHQASQSALRPAWMYLLPQPALMLAEPPLCRSDCTSFTYVLMLYHDTLENNNRQNNTKNVTLVPL